MMWKPGAMLGYWALDIMGTNENYLPVLTENMAKLSLKMTNTVVSSRESSGDIVKHFIYK